MEFKYIKDSRVDEDNVFIIKWRLCFFCNYTCPNCIQGVQECLDKSTIIETENTLYSAAEALDTHILAKLPSDLKVKIELVGGEVSLLDLIKVLNCIRDKKLWRIQLTTNFSRHHQYYIDLADYLKSRNIELSLAASYHETQTSLDTFLLKAQQVKKHCTLFSVEMVSTESNQELVEEFKALCEVKNLKYSIDGDKTEAGKDINVSSNKQPRYTVKFEDGSIVNFTTKSMLIRDKRFIQHRNMYIRTNGYYCSYGYHYIYVEVDKVFGPLCTDRKNIEEFKLKTALTKCPYTHCSLCGRMSLYKEDILNVSRDKYDKIYR